MSSRVRGNPLLLSWIILAVLSVIWGSSFILIKKGLMAFTPDTVGALRISASSTFLFIIALKRTNRVRRKHLIHLLAVGFLGSLLPAFLYAKGQTRIDSAVAGVLNAITPLWVIVIGFVVFSQNVTRRNLVGMLIGFAGTIWLVVVGSGSSIQLNYYALFIIAATICYGINLNLIKYRLPDLNSVTITSVSMMMVGPLAIGYLFFQTDFISVLQTDPMGWWSFGAVSLLGVLGTAIALVLFFKLVQINNPVFASSVTYLIPIVALIWGVLDGEKILMGQIAGMILILAGVFIANRKN